MVINNGSPNKLILIKPNQMKETELVKYYGNNFTAISIPDGAVARKELINDLKEAIPATTKCILVADADMFKTLCKVKKTSNLDGIPCDNILNIPFVFNYYEDENVLKCYTDIVDKFDPGKRFGNILLSMKDYIKLVI